MQAASNAEATPWGLGATALFALAIAAAVVAVQLVVESMLLRFQPVDADITGAGFFGLLLAVSTLVAAPVGIGLTLIAAYGRRRISLKQYLALRWPRATTLMRWFWYLIVFLVLFHAVEYFSGRPFVTNFELRVFQTAYSVPLLLLAVVVAAPCFEELFFRGFILTGVLASRLGVIGALLSTSALWAIMHAAQYAPAELLLVFLGGVLLGYARYKTRSVYVPIALHALWNLVAAVETMIYLAGRGATPATA